MFTHSVNTESFEPVHGTKWPVKLFSRKIRNNNWSLLLFYLNDSYGSAVIGSPLFVGRTLG